MFHDFFGLSNHLKNYQPNADFSSLLAKPARAQLGNHLLLSACGQAFPQSCQSTGQEYVPEGIFILFQVRQVIEREWWV